MRIKPAPFLSDRRRGAMRIGPSQKVPVRHARIVTGVNVENVAVVESMAPVHKP